MSAFSGSTLCLAQTLRDVDPLWISKEQVRHGYDACMKKGDGNFLMICMIRMAFVAIAC